MEHWGPRLEETWEQRKEEQVGVSKELKHMVPIAFSRVIVPPIVLAAVFLGLALDFVFGLEHASRFVVTTAIACGTIFMVWQLAYILVRSLRSER